MSAVLMIKAALAIVLAWTILCVIGSLGSYTDYLRRGEVAAYASILWTWWRDYLPLMLLNVVVFAILSAQPAAALRARGLILGYLAVIVIFMPIELLYIALIEMSEKGVPLTLSGAVQKVLGMRTFMWFLKFSWVTFTYIAVVGLVSWRESRARAKALLHAQADNLALRLQLEEQRLLALRAQLEPHYIFNALNAISALVRSDDKRVALDGIGHLSDLLRYALLASERDCVTVADERQFIDDYLALQAMRYGQRLQVVIEGDDAAVLSGDMPPLLLQPLIENALRHDLDCHDGPSDIRLVFTRAGERLTVRISNPADPARPPNPGLGLGLRHSRARLQLAYGDDAWLHTTAEAGRFTVEIGLPHQLKIA